MGGDRQKYSSDIAAVLSSSEDGAGNRFSDLISAVGFGSGRRIGGDVSTDLVLENTGAELIRVDGSEYLDMLRRSLANAENSEGNNITQEKCIHVTVNHACENEFRTTIPNK